MKLSLGPFITCFVTVFILTTYVYISIYVRKDVLYKGMKFVFAVILLILVRMFIPINFPFTISIPSYKVLPPISRLLFHSFPDTRVGLAEILLFVWLVGMVVKGFRLFACQKRYWHVIQPFRVKDWSEHPELADIMRANQAEDLPVCIVRNVVSPCIIGLYRPILVLPDREFTHAELSYICRHEIEHHRNHDLWLKLFLELVLCAQWFNPVAYYLENKLTLVFELSNDQKVLQECDEEQCLEYADCIMKVARTQTKLRKQYCGLSFFGSKTSDLGVRLNHILSDGHVPKKKNKLSLTLQYIFVILVMIGSFLVVPEAYQIDEDVQETTFEVTKENAYFVKTDEGTATLVCEEFSCPI